MKNQMVILTLVSLGVFLGSAAASAEDLTGADKILCAGVQATYCDTSGDSLSGPMIARSWRFRRAHPFF